LFLTCRNYLFPILPTALSGLTIDTSINPTYTGGNLGVSAWNVSNALISVTAISMNRLSILPTQKQPDFLRDMTRTVQTRSITPKYMETTVQTRYIIPKLSETTVQTRYVIPKFAEPQLSRTILNPTFPLFNSGGGFDSVGNGGLLGKEYSQKNPLKMDDIILDDSEEATVTELKPGFDRTGFDYNDKTWNPNSAALSQYKLLKQSGRDEEADKLVLGSL